jgi:hypothetical protein
MTSSVSLPNSNQVQRPASARGNVLPNSLFRVWHGALTRSRVVGAAPVANPFRWLGIRSAKDSGLAIHTSHPAPRTDKFECTDAACVWVMKPSNQVNVIGYIGDNQ